MKLPSEKSLKGTRRTDAMNEQEKLRLLVMTIIKMTEMDAVRRRESGRANITNFSQNPIASKSKDRYK